MKETNWKDTKTELPPENQEVLVKSGKGHFAVTCYYDGKWWPDGQAPNWNPEFWIEIPNRMKLKPCT